MAACYHGVPFENLCPTLIATAYYSISSQLQTHPSDTTATATFTATTISNPDAAIAVLYDKVLVVVGCWHDCRSTVDLHSESSVRHLDRLLCIDQGCLSLGCRRGLGAAGACTSCLLCPIFGATYMSSLPLVISLFVPQWLVFD